jgi:hypothetical protein
VNPAPRALVEGAEVSVAVLNLAAMTSTPQIVDEAEALLRQLAARLTNPRESECLCCYVARLLDEFPCDGTHRLAFHYRDTMAPRATTLNKRLSQVGACCCDCELFLNGYQLNPSPSGGAGFVDRDEGDFRFDALPGCAGVRRGSVQPCRNWVQIGRW